MVKARTVHRCTECGAAAARWLGRCPECGAWGALVEEELAAGRSGRSALATGLPPGAEAPLPIAEVDPLGAARRPTGIDELDGVLGGGLVAGSVTLIGGEPGMGKSTLLLQVLAHLAASGAKCLLVAAEESRQQVRLRAERLGALPDRLLLVAETSLPRVLAHVDAVAPDVLAVDSIQAVTDPELGGVPGSVTQVRECAHRLAQLAKTRTLTTLLVGHVTKDGTLAGPRALEHVVDTVLSFDGERHHALRMLRALKHRFGPTDELGLFEMGERGLVAVPDPSALFLADRRAGAPGSVVTAMLDGVRPLLVEVQALVVPSPAPRRSAQGLDAGRLPLLLAVLERHGAVEIAGADVFASVAGGVRVPGAGADLAVVLAVASAVAGRPVAEGVVALGEIGLGGEVRQVPQANRRLREAARLGFTRAVAPPSTPTVAGVDVARVDDVAEALRVGLAPAVAAA
jgi:DNA repair protein RadA/Sms